MSVSDLMRISSRTNMKKLSLLLIPGLVAAGGAAHGANFLTGTVWDEAAKEATCKLDPLLLYSVALQESRKASGKGTIKPHPLALRNGKSGSAYPSSMSEAIELLTRFIKEDRLTDIGAMQINYRWNGNRVSNPEQLLDLKTNIRVGADILCESVAAYPRDIRLAIGGYHTRNPKRKMDAIRYGEDVLYIWKRLEGDKI